MGFQEMKKPHHHDSMRLDEGQDGKKAVWLLAGGIALPLPLKPVKVGRRRADEEEEEEEEEKEEEAVTTPRGEGCRIPAEAATCPPAPKKPRTAVSISTSRRCNCDGELLEFFRVPADLEAVFVSRVAKAN